MVVVAATCAAGGRSLDHLGCLWLRVSGSVQANWAQRLWWSRVPNQIAWTLHDYQRDLKCLANQVGGWPQRTMIGTFLGGLKEEIAAEVKMFKPRMLREAIGKARMCDERLARKKKHARNELQKLTAITKNVVASTSTARQLVGSPIKEKSWEEMKRQQEKGLCFNCNERFTPGNKCWVPHVFLIENDNAWVEDGEEEEQEDHGSPANEQFSTPEKPEISLHALSR